MFHVNQEAYSICGAHPLRVLPSFLLTGKNWKYQTTKWMQTLLPTTILLLLWKTRQKVCQQRRRGRSSKVPYSWWIRVLSASWALTTGSPNSCRVFTPSASGAFLPPTGMQTPLVKSTSTKHVRTVLPYLSLTWCQGELICDCLACNIIELTR